MSSADRFEALHAHVQHDPRLENIRRLTAIGRCPRGPFAIFAFDVLRQIASLVIRIVGHAAATPSFDTDARIARVIS